MKIKAIAANLFVISYVTLLPAEEIHMHPMSGMYGPYAMTREASGTSWQPDSTPMHAIHRMWGDSMLMAHGYANAVYDDQGGRRGADQFYSTNMFMLMGQRSTPAGTVGFRSMMSLEPATAGGGKDGYPLLLQTGETADGKTPLVDRQHPHDLFMELAVTYNHSFGDESSAFAYFGWPGEPALGPPVFMHRYSGEQIPEAPISHHWMDSSHVTYGVGTAGLALGRFKLEGSLFRGKEPDQNRWDIEPIIKLDSYSGRLSFNPTENWALQGSYGHIVSPEALFPGFNTDRVTASVIHNTKKAESFQQTTYGWGRDINQSGHTLDAYIIESTLGVRDKHYFFIRGERVEEDELLDRVDPEGNALYLAKNPGGFNAPSIFLHPQFQQDTTGGPPVSPIIRRVFVVGKVSLGYLRNVAAFWHCQLGVGAIGSFYILPQELNPVYGESPTSFMLYTRLSIG